MSRYSKLTWEEKLEIIQSIEGMFSFNTFLAMRKPGNWYVQSRTHIYTENSPMIHGNYGNGKTPQEAVENHFKIYVEDIKDNQYVEYEGKKYRFEGHIWKEYK